MDFLIYEILLKINASEGQSFASNLQKASRLYLLPLNVGNEFGNLDSTFLMTDH